LQVPLQKPLAVMVARFDSFLVALLLKKYTAKI